jgi:hypothetical protein
MRLKMATNDVCTLQEAIRQALIATYGGATDEVIRWLRLKFRDVLDANSHTIEQAGLNSIIRSYRKKEKEAPEHAATVGQICLDFGLPHMNLDLEISVPGEEGVRWIDIDDATIDDLDVHAMMLLEKASECAAKARHIRALRQEAARYAGGRTDIPLRELRERARSNAGAFV